VSAKPPSAPSRRFIHHEGRWSDQAATETGPDLREFLVRLSDEQQRQADPCHELMRWTDLGLSGRILDLGCGTAWKCHCLSRHPSNWVVGCDLGRPLLEYGRKKFHFSSLVQCDGTQLPFPTGWFDWVMAIEVIEHVLDARELLCEIKRVLRPGGKLLLTTPNRLQYLRPWRPTLFCRALCRRVVLDASHVQEYDAGELRRLFPPGLDVSNLVFRGTLCGWPRLVSIEKVPQPFRRWWAQGIEIVARKAAVHAC